tara:strand:+ start:213 stop:1382 length:1170 start_codon:yes stop_codon:yes gene_type:complete
MDNARLQKNSTFSDIEHLCQRICDSDDIKLQIPNKLAESGIFGIEGAALQLFATWLRKNKPNEILHTAVADKLSPEGFTDLCNSAFGLVSLRLSDQIWSNSKEPIDRRVALTPAIPIFEKLRAEDYKNSFKGLYVAIPAIRAASHHSRNREFDSPLYNNEHVVNAEKFKRIVEHIISSIVPSKMSKEMLNDDTIYHISEIIRELFSNTHRHGRTDEKGRILAKNFRLITFRSHDITNARLQKIIGSGGGDLALFGSNWMPNKDGHLRVLDVTVSDSGPGYARRWTGLSQNELTPQDETNAVINCFIKNRSSDVETSSGVGLSNVLLDLRRVRGWFRLRTGRISVEKAFFDEKTNARIERKDIHCKSNFMDGTSFNFVIPLSVSGGKEQQ